MSPKNPKDYIKVKLTGSPEDNGKVRLTDFREFLPEINDCLSKIDQLSSQGLRNTLYFRITDLEAGSASVTIEPVPFKPEINNSKIVLDKFTEDLVTIQEKKQLPKELDYELLQNYKGLTSTLKKYVSSIQIIRPNRTLQITKQLESNIESALGEDITSMGSIEGFLEVVNVHKQNHFFIYPTISTHSIKCVFPEEMLPAVGQALKRYVKVSGMLRYKRGMLFPYQVDA